MASYTEEQLRKIQRIELSILKDFDQLCKDNGLDYFLIGGSAIGAVRHKGFIPWDDDIDVAMSRNDYDKFLDIAKKYNNKYNIVNNDNNIELAIMNLRWSLKGTKFIPEEYYRLKNQNDYGIFLDIFCFDNVADDEDKSRKQITKAWLYGKLMVMSEINKPVLYFKGVKKVLFRIICFVGHYILRVLGFNARYFYLKAIKEAKKYQNTETKRFAYMFEPKRYASLLNKDDVFPTKKAKFEDMYVNIPNNIDKLLTTRYGDYMKIPDPKDRHSHPPFILDFGDNDI